MANLQIEQRTVGLAVAIFGIAGMILSQLIESNAIVQQLVMPSCIAAFFAGASLIADHKAVAFGLLVLAGAAYIGYFVVYSHYAIRLFQFPFDYDQGEGFELMDTILLSQGRSPYRDNDVYPFYSSNYPPVFHVALVPLVWLFGPSYWIGRLVSYLGTLMTAMAIGWGAKRISRRTWLAILCGLTYLASNFLYHVGPLFRQHPFMVMFETLAVILLAHTLDQERDAGTKFPARLFIVLALLSLAGYTKQLAYATAIAVFLYLLLTQPRRAIRWGIPFTAIIVLIFAGLVWLTDGEWLTATVTANVNPFVPGQTIALYTRWFTLHLIITLAAIAGTIIYGQQWRNGNRKDSIELYLVWFWVTALNSVTAGKWGAGESYFLTTIAASCILTAYTFDRWLEWSINKSRSAQLTVATLIPLLFLWQADKFFHMPTHTPALKLVAAALGKPTETMIAPQTSCSDPLPDEPIPFVDSAFTLVGRPPTEEDTNAGIHIAHLISQAGDSPAFSEEAGFNLFLGRDVVTNPTQLLNLYNNDAVDLSAMEQALADKQFDSVVLRAQFYPPPILHQIGQNYDKKHFVQMNGFVYCIFEAKPD